MRVSLALHPPLQAAWLALLMACWGMAASRPARAADAPERIWSNALGRAVSRSEMLAELSGADVVFLGEQHHSAGGHRLELAILEGLAPHRRIALSMEMFERDVQPFLDGYLAGHVPERQFLEDSRPWPNYATDYRPLVEYARGHGIPVLAANVPRSLAGMMSQQGPAALLGLPLHTLPLLARHTSAPHDAYAERFAREMKTHPGAVDRAAAWRFYQAQCLKDDTMAESIADYLERTDREHRLVLHVTGGFHSDFGLGTVARTRSRAPHAVIRTVSLVPMDKPAAADPTEDVGRADYVIYYREQ